jgi:glycosyltransferase involved in cell wall biosynthesis
MDSSLPMKPQRAEPIDIIVLPVNELKGDWERGEPIEGFDLRMIFRVLEKRGFRTELLNLNPRPVNPLARRHPIWRAIDPVRALKALIFRRRAEIAFCAYESSAVLLLLLRKIFRSKIRVVVYDCGTPGDWPLRDRLIDIIGAHADAMMLICATQAWLLQARYPNPSRFTFVAAAVDTQYFLPAADQPLGPVIAVGDDVARDFDTFRAAVAPIPVRAIAKTRMIRQDLTNYPNLRVLSQRLSREAYRDLLASAIVVVVPLHSAVHASGISTLLEAMALGKAIVISDSPGIRDYVVNEGNCLVVPCNDRDALQAAIARLVDDREFRVRLASNARTDAEQRYSPEAVAPSFEKILRPLADGNG